MTGPDKVDWLIGCQFDVATRSSPTGQLGQGRRQLLLAQNAAKNRNLSLALQAELNWLRGNPGEVCQHLLLNPMHT